VTFLWRVMGCPEPESGASPFRDVAPEAYYYKAVLWASQQGITVGTGNGCFSPDAPVTRGQAVTLLWRLAGSPAAESAPFADVKADSYYAKAVSWAYGRRITEGTGPSTFSPEDSCLRGQIVTFLYRYFAG